MTNRPILSTRLRRLSGELARFATVGGAGMVVNFLVFNLVHLKMDVQVGRANVISISVAIAFNYFGFRYFTYRDRDKQRSKRELTLFLFFSVIGLIIETGTVFITTYGFHWDSPLQVNVFKFLGVLIASCFRFWSYRSWVFRALPEPPDPMAAGGDGTKPLPDPIQR
ncbi:MAG: GtrA family protein [Kitasatospora sp.]|jgi:putative flippase GtrA|nr:GtrA family protein [Kitasatospora sp.]